MRVSLVAAAVIAACGFISAAQSAPLRPRGVPIDTVDVGPTTPDQVISASLILKVHNPLALELRVAATQEPLSPFYHRFLSVPEFASQFAPGSAELAAIKKYLSGFGIQITETYEDHLLLKVTGTVAAFDKAFSTDVHDYVRSGRRFHRPRFVPQVPSVLRDIVAVVEGLSTESNMFRPMNSSRAGATGPSNKPPVLPHAGAIATGVPGDYTVGDVANLYNINPLYAAHIDGKGRTVGIATLANFVPADAYQYWSLIGLDVLPDRITQVHVDGGGQLTSDAGSGETSLDVEQSGGIAPQAKMIVYDAPNTEVGFYDMFYKAFSDNKVDSLSVSWGEAEEFYYGEVIGEDHKSGLQALHQAFLEAAVQGISLFASSGDSGAYDINDAFDDPVDNVLTVDSPGSDPAITSAGGTTVPYTFNAGKGAPDFVVSTEGVWSWSDLQDYLVNVRGPQYQDFLFPEGGGGGVSTYWPVPYYQLGIAGIRTTEPHQSVVYDDGSGAGPQDLLDLPARFHGRNVPDVSLNADPFSGYIVYSSTDGGLIDGYGGTSFVAPQLNGIATLLAQRTGGRLGLLNPILYRMQRVYGYSRQSPLVDITAGDNWFYQGVRGYEPGAGLGVLDVNNLALALDREKSFAGH